MHVLLPEQSLHLIVRERQRQAEAYDHVAGFAIAPRWQRRAPSWRSRLARAAR